MVQPRADDTVAAQVAAVLVRDHVVRVVRPRAVEPRPADHGARDRAARHHADAPVGQLRARLDELVEVRLGHSARLVVEQLDRRLRVDADLLAAHVDDPGLRHVVAEGVEEPRADHLGAGRKAEVLPRVRLDEVGVAARVLDREARRDAARLAADDRPGAGRVGAVVAIGPAPDLRDRHRAHADAVLEPGRVRHLAERVDALRGRDHPLPRLAPEGVGERVPGARPVHLAGTAGDVEVVGVLADGVGGVEALGRGRARRGEGQDGREGDGGERPILHGSLLRSSGRSGRGRGSPRAPRRSPRAPGRPRAS